MTVYLGSNPLEVPIFKRKMRERERWTGGTGATHSRDSLEIKDFWGLFRGREVLLRVALRRRPTLVRDASRGFRLRIWRKERVGGRGINIGARVEV